MILSFLSLSILILLFFSVHFILLYFSFCSFLVFTNKNPACLANRLADNLSTAIYIKVCNIIYVSVKFKRILFIFIADNHSHQSVGYSIGDHDRTCICSDDYYRDSSPFCRGTVCRLNGSRLCRHRYLCKSNFCIFHCRQRSGSRCCLGKIPRRIRRYQR